MNAKPISFVVVALLAAGILWFVHSSMVREGVPQIEAAVRQEVVALSISHDKLHTLQLGHASQWHTKTRDDLVTGYFVFSASYLGAPAEIRVSWSKADTNSPIDKIEKTGTYQEPETLWSRK